MRRSIRLALAAVVVAELLLLAALWLPRLARHPSPAVEERHYITLVVRDPEGRVVEERTYETRSFTYTDVLAIRLFSTWYIPGSVFCSRMYFPSGSIVLDSFGRYQHTISNPWYLHDDLYYSLPSSLVFLGSGTSSDGGRTLGSPLGASAAPSVGYAYNDQWFNVTVTATFSFSEGATVSEAMLAVLIWDGGTSPEYVSVVYDSFSAVSVPAGGSLTVQWVFAWKDYGALTENWGRLWQYALTLNAAYYTAQYINFTDDTGAVVRIPWPNTYIDAHVALRLAWGTGTSPASRSSYRLEREAGSVQAGYTVHGTGLSVGGAVGSQATEVGLYWLAVDDNGNLRRILLMRWVPGYALPAGTPINVYVARGG